jgi:type II secretory ATPase GspE/PulE/Tfp pilus assembly ATPase PilB-like protein
MPLVFLAALQTGPFINPWKVVPPVVLLAIWVKLLSWIDKDGPEARLNREAINSSLFAGLILGYTCIIFVPGFTPAFSILVSLFVVEIAVYLFLRSRTIGLADLRGKLADWWNNLIRSKKVREVKVAAGEVLVMDKNGHAEEVPDAESAELPRYEAAQKFLTKPLRLNAERLELVAGEPAVVGFVVDGVRYDGDAMDRNAAGAAVQFIKRVAGLDMNERRKPQTGKFRAAMDGTKFQIQVTSFGSTAGESIRLVTNPNDRMNFKLDALGFSEDQLEQFRKLITDDTGGVVLLAMPRSQGLTSLGYAVIRAHDAFLQHVHTVERAPDFDLEGITQNALAANASPAEESKQVSWVISQEPDVVMLTSIEDPKSAVDLSKYAGAENRRAYVLLRAPNALEALKLWRKLVGDDGAAMKNLKAVIAGRLMRRLCGACKVGYTPDPGTLKKLNMNPDVVGKLYQARKEPMRDAKGNPVPCNFCHDLAYKGRMGIYEMMKVDDELRAVVKAGGSDSQIKQVMRKQRSKSLQEVALLQVQLGETSVEEVVRVLLKGDTGDASSSGSSGQPARPKPRTGPAPSTQGGTSSGAPRAAAPKQPRPAAQ